MSFKLRLCITTFILAVCFISFASCGSPRILSKANLMVESSLGETVPLRVELARTTPEMERGYMDRKSIPDGTGMLFIYTVDKQMHFWMKNTPHPLSIAFIDSDGVIREIRELTPFSEATVSSTRSVRYALEVPAGWFARTGISPGDRLRGLEPEVSLSAALLAVPAK